MEQTETSGMSVAEVIQETEGRFADIAPRGLSYAAEKGFAIQALRNNDFLMKTAQNNPTSLQQAITNVAAIGLSLSPAEHLAYLVPRQGRICLDVSYQGFCRLATNSGSIEWVQARIVYANDQFLLGGVNEQPAHKFDPFGDRGDMRGVYVVAKTTSGDYLTEVMTIQEINDIRDRSEAWKANQSGPWKTDFGEMAKKTVVRRAFKMWPKTDQHALERMALAVQLSNENEGFDQIKTSPKITHYTDDQKAYFDQLIEANDAIGMAMFKESIEEGVFISLYNSFEQGKKGMYKTLVNELTAKGAADIADYRNEFVLALDEQQDLKILEMAEELSEDKVAFILDGLHEHVAKEIYSIIQNAGEAA